MLTWVIQRARDVFPSRSSMSRDDIVERIRVPGFGIGETTKCLLRATSGTHQSIADSQDGYDIWY